MNTHFQLYSLTYSRLAYIKEITQKQTSFTEYLISINSDLKDNVKTYIAHIIKLTIGNMVI